MTDPELPALVSPRELATARARRAEIRVLDVRTPGEFARTHIEGAYNVPLDRLHVHAAELRAVAAPVVLVCRSGARARGAQALLREGGMRNLHLLEGGMIAWRAIGLPVLRAPVRPARLLRWGVALAAVVAGVVVSGEYPLLAAVLLFVGLRVGLGQSLLPCAAAGACAVPGDDTDAVVRACVDGRPPEGVTRPAPADSPAT